MLDKMQIVLRDVRIIGDISISCVVNRCHIRLIQQKLMSRGDRVEILHILGMANQINKIVKRPVLVFSTMLIALLSIFAQNRILFIEVEGNVTVPTNQILEQAAQTGIHFGATRRSVKSENVKNTILSEIPDLQWFGVTTSGCVANILVKERNITEETRVEERFVSNMIATQDGIITECTVRRGNCLCQIGQAVTAGELLVSGYTDCGLIVRATQVDAEIAADTLREVEAVTPATYAFRSQEIGRKKYYSLLIGKKLINFFKDSGISDTTCVKMYEKKCLTLPGGMTLPIAVIIEEHVCYEMDTVLLPEEVGSALLEKTAKDYLVSKLVSGRINKADILVQSDDGLYRLVGRYACNEMIGQVVYEESAYNYGENN